MVDCEEDFCVAVDSKREQEVDTKSKSSIIKPKMSTTDRTKRNLHMGALKEEERRIIRLWARLQILAKKKKRTMVMLNMLLAMESTLLHHYLIPTVYLSKG